MVIYYKIQCLKIYILNNPTPGDLSDYKCTLKYNFRYIGEVYMRYTCYCVCLILTCIK